MKGSSSQRKPGAARPAAQGAKKASLDNIVQNVITESSRAATNDSDVLNQKLQAHVQQDDQAPVVMLVDALLREALRRGASDIHIEPFEENLRIRFRIDGALQEIQQLPVKLTNSMVSRLKIMAELDIVERRIPQDGVIRMRTPEGEDADFRVSTLPSIFGEKAVLRVLAKDSLNKDLENVGLSADRLEIIRKQIRKPDGMMLVTGPTGSGKTTTLYASLSEINEPSKSIFTAEDPVEGTLHGITQVQVNPSVGLNFSTVLRSLLRQDPDVILVGEIRDKETIDIAIKAALTGHFVLSTLHTNDTAATIQRLLNMGVEPYLIASAVNIIVAQRLVRRICKECKEPVEIDSSVLQSYGIEEGMHGHTLYTGAGCNACNGTGFSGRAAVYEIMLLNDRIKDAILKGASQAQIKTMARRQGMLTLREAGIELIKQGITSLDEVIAKTNDDDDLMDEVSPVAGQSPAADSAQSSESSSGLKEAGSSLLKGGIKNLEKALGKSGSGGTSEAKLETTQAST